jgi:hypothetical protein
MAVIHKVNPNMPYEFGMQINSVWRRREYPRTACYKCYGHDGVTGAVYSRYQPLHEFVSTRYTANGVMIEHNIAGKYGDKSISLQPDCCTDALILAAFKRQTRYGRYVSRNERVYYGRVQRQHTRTAGRYAGPRFVGEISGVR